MRYRGDREFVAERFRSWVVEIPHEAVHAGFAGKNLRGPDPIHGDGICRGDFLERLGWVRARVAADEMIFGVEDFQSDGLAGRRREVIIENGAVWRIFARGDFRGKRRIRVAVPAKANSFLRLEQG